MNDVEHIKHEGCPQKTHLRSKNFCDIPFLVLKISVVYKENIYLYHGVITWILC